jgi:hypothetical protein
MLQRCKKLALMTAIISLSSGKNGAIEPSEN